MLNKTLLALGIALTLLTAGCERAADPAPKPAVEEPPGDPLADSLHAPEPGAKLRLTLGADGEPIKIEGVDAGGNWEDERDVFKSAPESMGDIAATIEIHKLNDSTKNLMKPDGSPAHVDSGQGNPPYNTHCHRVVYIPPNYYMVHCGT